MNIQVNGETKQLPDGHSAADLIESMGLTGKRIAMEVNREILPRSEYSQYQFREGDVVEIVHAIGGGAR